jgi:hypothetical protein
MKKMLGFLAVIFIVFLPLRVFAGQITITKSGNSFTSFVPGNEDYKPSPIYEGGILLGDGADNSNPIYEFILPPKTHSSGNQIDYIQVRLVGDDYTNYSLADTRIIIGADNFETSIQATKAWSWTGSVALGRLADGGDESILKVTLVVNEGWAKFDLEKIEVTYGYSNVSTGILDTWQNLYTANKSFQDFSDNTVPTWDGVSTSVNYLKDGVKQCRSFANNVSNIGSSTLYNALTSANSAVDDLVEIEGTLSGSFSIIPWVTSYGVLEASKGPGNYYPTGIIANFDDVLPNLSTLVSNYFLYAFDDGDVDFDDYDLHLEPALIGLRSSSGGMPDLELGMNTAADIIKTIYINQQSDIAEAMFYSLAPMYTPGISGSDVNITPSYLHEFSDYIDALVLYNPVPVPDRPTLFFPANDTFAKGSSITLYWNETATATNYHLQVSLNSSFSDLVYEVFGIELTSASFSAVPDNGSTKLYWRVKAGNASGWGLYSDYWMFTSGCMNGDFDSDCDADINDLEIFVSRWLDTGCSSFDLCEGTDMVRSGDVDFEDFAAFTKQWQKTAPIPPDSPYPPEPDGMVWVYINDPGVPGHEPFNGYMSKYETTNSQYCEFLNAALVSGDIYVDGSSVKGTDGSNSGADFVDERYYNIAGSGGSYNEATNGGAARINYTGSSFTVDSGFENHPVTYVDWYGAAAFCNYYGWRLPTEWEWQAVGDYDGSYNYGCGTSINNDIANYSGSTHPDGTTVVGSFGTYGYGICDMSGNVWEFTNTYPYIGNASSIRGGGWYGHVMYAHISDRSIYYPSMISLGFRVCR